MKRKTLPILISCVILAAFLLVGSAEALDMGFKCGSYLVAVGDRAYDVLKKCGDPVYVESWQEVRARGDIDPWTVEPGRRYYIGPCCQGSQRSRNGSDLGRANLSAAPGWGSHPG
jgi:hypothetical protein